MSHSQTLSIVSIAASSKGLGKESASGMSLMVSWEDDFIEVFEL